MTDITVPGDAIDAAARADYESVTGSLWSDAYEHEQTLWRANTLTVLTAAAPFLVAWALEDEARRWEDVIIPSYGNSMQFGADRLRDHASRIRAQHTKAPASSGCTNPDCDMAPHCDGTAHERPNNEETQ